MHSDILQPEELEYIFMMFQESESAQQEPQPQQLEPMEKEEAA